MLHIQKDETHVHCGAPITPELALATEDDEYEAICECCNERWLAMLQSKTYEMPVEPPKNK